MDKPKFTTPKTSYIVTKTFKGRNAKYPEFKGMTIPEGTRVHADQLVKLGFNKGFEQDKLERDGYIRPASIDEKEHEELLSLQKIKMLSEPPQKLALAMFQFTDPDFITENFWAKQPVYYDRAKMWWLWNHNKKKWEMVDETDLVIEANRLYNLPQGIEPHVKNKIIETLKVVGRTKSPKKTPNTWIQFANVIVDVETKETFEPSPQYFCTNPIPWELGDKTETPTIDRIFEEWVGKDKVKLLYQIMAYCMIPSYPMSRLFVLIGAGRNGKSKYLELLTRFIGSENRSSTELDTLIDNRFETAKLYKKLVCLMGETNFTSLKRTSILKRLTGGDTIGFEFKNKNPFDDYNYAKIVIATNSLPMTYDKTEGFYRRWCIIDFPNKFSEKKDVLASIPVEEFACLAAKCLEYLYELLEVREFHMEGTVEERRALYEAKSDPLSAFLKERCHDDVNGTLEYYRFYDEFSGYLQQRGYRELSKKMVSGMLKEHGYEIQKLDIKVVNEQGVQEFKKYACVIGLIMTEMSHRTNRTNRTDVSIDSTCIGLSGSNGSNGTNGTKGIPENHTSIQKRILDDGKVPQEIKKPTSVSTGDSGIIPTKEKIYEILVGEFDNNPTSTTELLQAIGCGEEALVEALKTHAKNGLVSNAKNRDTWIWTG